MKPVLVDCLIGCDRIDTYRLKSLFMLLLVEPLKNSFNWTNEHSTVVNELQIKFVTLAAAKSHKAQKTKKKLRTKSNIKCIRSKTTLSSTLIGLEYTPYTVIWPSNTVHYLCKSVAVQGSVVLLV